MSTSGMKTGQATAEARRAILRIQAGVLACVCGLLGGVGLSGLTLSWVNKLGSEDSGAPPADSPGTSSRVVRTSFASIPGLSL